MNILIGISGGIAAYKIPELIRLFIKNGDKVKVILTSSAKMFLTEGLLASLSGEPVYCDFEPETGEIEHIELARWADIFIIAPATANTISSMANGDGSNVLLATALAYRGFLAMFPSMNADMLEHSATQSNIKKIKEFGYKVYDSDEGSLACGVNGKGRLPSVDFIFNAVLYDYKRLNTKSKLKGINFVLSMGYTKAFIDPVRFVSNGSSGQMGFELARSIYEQGGNLKIIINPEILDKYTILDYFADELKIVETTQDALKEAKDLFKDTNFYISVAAFSDFDSLTNTEKLKPTKGAFSLDFKKAPDILKELAKEKKTQKTIGFALESSNLEDLARQKLEDKSLDMIIANDVNAIGADNSNIIIIHKKGRTVNYNSMPKKDLASIIISEVERGYLR